MQIVVGATKSNPSTPCANSGHGLIFERYGIKALLKLQHHAGLDYVLIKLVAFKMLMEAVSAWRKSASEKTCSYSCNLHWIGEIATHEIYCEAGRFQHRVKYLTTVEAGRNNRFDWMPYWWKVWRKLLAKYRVSSILYVFATNAEIVDRSGAQRNLRLRIVNCEGFKPFSIVYGCSLSSRKLGLLTCHH